VLCGDPDRAAPTEFATFKKVRGAEGQMAVGDEYLVRMPGPWDGPVRVLERTPTSFRLATLAGHLEAGQIRFSVEGAHPLEMGIESWARAGDRLSNLLFDHLRMSKEVQLHMWTSFLERAVKLSGGRRTGPLAIHTRRVPESDFDAGPGGRHALTGDGHGLAALDQLHDREVSFDLRDWEPDHLPAGWRHDEYCQALPPEPPGDPVPEGSWEIAKRLMADYEFADPKIIHAVFRDDSPYEGRDMLLEAHFLGLRFHFGVRVGGLIDELRDPERGGVRVWGWYYETLQGHLEQGRMRFELWKWLDDGRVEFHISVVSRPARIPNPLIRWGFRVFGRGQQVRFARHACERMARLTAEELGARVPTVERAAEEIPVAVEERLP
jgi:uncharacterized protein (UPF0548 family)